MFLHPRACSRILGPTYLTQGAPKGVGSMGPSPIVGLPKQKPIWALPIAMDGPNPFPRQITGKHTWPSLFPSFNSIRIQEKGLLLSLPLSPSTTSWTRVRVCGGMSSSYEGGGYDDNGGNGYNTSWNSSRGGGGGGGSPYDAFEDRDSQRQVPFFSFGSFHRFLFEFSVGSLYTCLMVPVARKVKRKIICCRSSSSYYTILIAEICNSVDS